MAHMQSMYISVIQNLKQKAKQKTRVGFETSKAFFIGTYVTVSKIYISPLSIYSTNGLDLENTIQIHFGSHANDMTVCLIFV